jgi:hypothetical protein
VIVPGHLDDLRRSGLSSDTIRAAGFYSGTEPQVREILGYGASAGLVIPYRPLNGGGSYARVKLDKPGADGKKYRAPSKQPNRLYVPAMLSPGVLQDPRTPLWVTEGEKKGLKACQEGLPCVALSGVWSWRTRERPDDKKSKSVPLPDLDHIAWNGRTVYIVFDSDLVRNPKVKAAELALAQELSGRGAKVFAVRLPDGPAGEKVGLDDYLLTHTVQTLCAIEPVEIPTRQHDERGQASPAISRIRFRAGSELDNTPVRYHVEDMLPAGMLAALGGKDGMGKTQLGMEIIKGTLTGQPLFGRFAVQQGPVYALFLDDPEFLVRERLAALGILNHPDLHVATENDVDMSQPRAMLAQLIEMLKAATPRPKFIFVDALYLFIPSGGQGDQGNSAGAMAPVIDAFNQVTRETGATLLLVAHDNKAGGDIAGSYAIRAGLKAILRVMLPPAVARQVAKGDEEARETSERMLQLNKLKTGRPASWYLRLDGPGQWTFHGGATAYQRATLPARVIENLWGREESTVEELAKDLHARPADVRRTCAELYLADQITRGERPRVDGKPGRGAEVYGLKSPPRVPARGDGTDSSGNYGTDRVGGNYGTDRSGEEVQEKLGDSAGGTLSVPPPSAGSRAARPIRPVIPTEGYPSHNPAPPCPRHPITPVPDLCDACRRRVA